MCACALSLSLVCSLALPFACLSPQYHVILINMYGFPFCKSLSTSLSFSLTRPNRSTKIIDHFDRMCNVAVMRRIYDPYGARTQQNKYETIDNPIPHALSIISISFSHYTKSDLIAYLFVRHTAHTAV